MTDPKTIHCPCCNVECKFHPGVMVHECPNGCCPVDTFYYVKEYEERMLNKIKTKADLQ